MKQDTPLTIEEINEIMNEINNSDDCVMRYKDGIISGCSDRHFSRSIENNYWHIGEITYDEILRNAGEGDDEYFVRIKLDSQYIPTKIQNDELVSKLLIALNKCLDELDTYIGNTPLEYRPKRIKLNNTPGTRLAREVIKLATQ